MTGQPITPQILSPYLINILCGALILFLLDIWLRRRNAPNASLIWLYLSLLSWAAAIALESIQWKGLEAIFPIKPENIKYLFSPVSSILFVVTAFRLARVRERLSNSDLRFWRRTAVGSVIFFSAIALLVMYWQYPKEARYIDACASSIAGFALGLGILYSFNKYGNRPLALLTGLTFLIFIARQFYLADHPTPTHILLAPLFVSNTTLVVMLFITLGVAWALSTTSRLKPVGGATDVKVIAMSFDLRGSTQWANDERDFAYVKTFMDDLREWLWSRALKSPQGDPNLIKFLGDGFLFVWEVQNNFVTGDIKTVVKLASDLCDDYPLWVKEKKLEGKFPWGVPEGIGIGVDMSGSTIRFTFENGSDDYLGSPVNLAAKMQNLARPHGVVIQAKVWEKLLDDDLRSKFPKESIMKLGDTTIPIRMTKDVGFKGAE